MKQPIDLSAFPSMKTCTRCAQDKPRTAEYFEPCRALTRDGLRTACRECERERDRQYRRDYRARKRAAKKLAEGNKP